MTDDEDDEALAEWMIGYRNDRRPKKRGPKRETRK